MNTKNSLIEKLLKVARRHKILTYPVLALVAVISVFSYLFNWSTGAGKRVVAVVMVMVMLVSQSYFLTSSATENTDDTLTTEEISAVTNPDTPEDTTAEHKQTTDLTDDDIQENSPSDTDQTKDGEGIDSADFSESIGTDDTALVVPGDDAVADTAYGEETGVSDAQIPSTVAVGDTIQCIGMQIGGGNVFTDIDAVEISSVGATKTYQISAADYQKMQAWLTNDALTMGGYYECDGWYTDSNCTKKLGADGIFTTGIKNTYQYFYYKRTVLTYKVRIAGVSLASFSVEGNNITTNEDGTYNIPADNGKATFTIKNLKYNEPYEATKVSVTSPSTAYLTTDKDTHVSTVTVTLAGNQYDPTVSIDEWKPVAYTIRYATSDKADAAIRTLDVKYDGRHDIPVPDVGLADDKTGYQCEGWVVNGTVFYPNAEWPLDVWQYLYEHRGEDSAIIIPYYGYRGVDAKPGTIEFQYKKEEATDSVIKGYYTGTSDTGNFTYEITDDSQLAAYNISAVAGQNGIYVKPGTGGPSQKTPDSGIQLSFRITDPDCTDPGERTKDYSVTIHVKPQTVTVSDSNTLIKKVYDGTSDCAWTGRLSTNVSGIYVDVRSCAYDLPDAGNRTVNLTSYEVVEGDAVTGSGNYILENKTAPGFISKRPVYIGIAVACKNGQYARTGDAKDPQYSIVWDSALNNQDGCGLVARDKNLDLTQYFECTLSPTRDDEAQAMENETWRTYYVVGVQAKDNSNYDFKYEGASVPFSVVLENADTCYGSTADLENLDWCSEDSQIKIWPLTSKGYNQVYVKGSSGPVDILTLTEENTQDGSLTFRLRDSATGAFTGWKTITVKVDKAAPIFDTYTISEAGTGQVLLPDDPIYPTTQEGLFFPTELGPVSFGNYFNNTVTFTVTYRDTRSGPHLLHYTLSDELNSGTERTAVFTAADEYGRATATFEILAEFAGKINLWAEDYAGNVSEPKVMTRNGSDEWVVETGGPTVGKLVVQSVSDRGVITVPDNGNGYYYSNCKAFFSAKDAVSGLYSVTWYVNGVEYSERVSAVKDKITELDFETAVNQETFPDVTDGKFQIQARVTDNAGNQSLYTNMVTVNVDDVAPEVDIDPHTFGYSKNLDINVKATDDLSGFGSWYHLEDVDHKTITTDIIRSVTVSEDELTASFTFNTADLPKSEGGIYYLIVEDKAGNRAGGSDGIMLDLSKVSDEKPNCPKLLVNNKEVSEGANKQVWYNSAGVSEVKIVSDAATENDNVPVTTSYTLSLNNQTVPVSKGDITDGEEVISPLEDGYNNIQTQVKAANGESCAHGSHSWTINVDTLAPVIKIVSVADNVVKFTVKDNTSKTNNVSGVDKVQVLYGYGDNLQVLPDFTSRPDANGYYSFKVTQNCQYVIQATDKAGNATETTEETTYSRMNMRLLLESGITTTTATVGAKVIAGTGKVNGFATVTYEDEYGNKYTVNNVPVMNSVISTVLGSDKALTPGTSYRYTITASSSIPGETVSKTGYFKTLPESPAGADIRCVVIYTQPEMIPDDGIVSVGLYSGVECIDAKKVDVGVEDEWFENIPDGTYNLKADDGIRTRTVGVVISGGAVQYPEGEDAYTLVMSSNMTNVVVSPEIEVAIGEENVDRVSVDGLEQIFDEELAENYTDEDKEFIENGGTVEFIFYVSLRAASQIDSQEQALVRSKIGNKVVDAWLDLSIHKVWIDSNNVEVKRFTNIHNLEKPVTVTIPLGELASKPNLDVIRVHNNYAYSTQDGYASYTGWLSGSNYIIQTNQFSTYAIVHFEEDNGDNNNTPGNGDNSGSNSGNTSGSGTTTTNSNNKKKTSTNSSKSNTASVGSLRSAGSAKTGDETPVMMLGVLMVTALGGMVVLRKKSKQSK